MLELRLDPQKTFKVWKSYVYRVVYNIKDKNGKNNS